jgi:spore coat polysaccharide biosynthesis protein SpsF (cytidylyltransferase family)
LLNGVEMSVVCVIQARMSSTRLPGKVLMDVQGKPMLQLELERVKRSTTLDKVVIATSTDPSDDAIWDFCESIQQPCFRGSLHDVMDRYCQAAKANNANIVVRVTGDCPLIDYRVIDECVNKLKLGGCDLVGNHVYPTWPDGLDVEAFKFSALEKANAECEHPFLREHVTLFIKYQPSIFKIGHVKNAKDLSRKRWTLDYQEDYDLLKSVYDGLYENNQDFTTEDILKFLEKNPHLEESVKQYSRYDGIDVALKESNIPFKMDGEVLELVFDSDEKGFK